MAEEVNTNTEASATDTGAAITGEAPAEISQAQAQENATAVAGENNKPATTSEDGAAKAEGDAALTGEAQPEVDAIDWEKITDDEYMAKIALPEGQEWNKEAMVEYTKLLKENKIDPKIFEKFVLKDMEMQKARAEKSKAESDKKGAEARAAFKAAGEEFRKTYTPEQVKEMNSTLAKIDDPTFKALVAKSPLANNKTMGKMLLAYEQVYGEGGVRGAAGHGDGGEKTFEQVWTGK